MRANVDGTLAMLEGSRRAGVKRFVYAASSSCYGLAEVPTTEAAPIAPQYPYALSKYMGEVAALHWGKVYRLPVVCLRIFNAYGPRARTTGAYGAVFGVFLAQRAHGRPLTVVGDGTQRRDFVYVPRRPGEPDCTWADISKIGRTLGWKPAVSFEDGVATMLRGLDQWRSAPVWTPESIATATKSWFQYLSGVS